MAVIDRERIDTVLLIVAFILGIGFIILLKIGNIDDNGILLPALTSAAVIIAYVVVALTSSRARLDPGQIGDNAYYLGFVLTLASLAVTLYYIQEPEPNPKSSQSFAKAVSGFGIALSSTIVGVIARVVLLQYRVDVVAREREIRLQLNDAMRHFHVEVQDFVRGSKYLGVEVRQTLDEHHRQMADSYGQQIEKLVEDLSIGFQNVLVGIAKQSEKSNKELVSSTRSSISSLEKSVLETLNTVSRQLRDTNAEVNEGTRAAADALERSLRQTSESMSEGLGDLQNAVRRSVEEISESYGQHIERFVEDLSVGHQKVLDGIVELSKETNMELVSGTRGSVSSVEKSVLETLTTVSRQLRETNAEVGEGTRSAAGTLRRSLQRASELMLEGLGELRAEVRRSVAEIAGFHTESMRLEATLMEEFSTSTQQAIGSFADGFEKNLGKIEETTAKFVDASSQLHEAVDLLGSDLELLRNRVQNMEKFDHSSRRSFWKFSRKT